MAANAVIKINLSISDTKTFDASMQNLGYAPVSKSFLTKNINGIEINITRRNNNVESMVGYRNNDIIELPQDIINQVQNDIKSCL